MYHATSPSPDVVRSGSSGSTTSLQLSLTAHFGRPFIVERLDQIDRGTLDEGIQSLIDELYDATSARSFLPGMAGWQQLALAWSVDEEIWVALADCQAGEEPLLQLLFESWQRERAWGLEAAELSLRNQRLTRQVSQGFKELALARHLATALSACDASKNLHDFAELILPDLRRTIRANTVALVIKDDRGRHTVRAIDHADDRELSVAQILRCVEQLASECRYDALVSSDPAVAAQLGDLCVGRLIIVSVHKGDDVAGWLVALDPVNQQTSDDDGFLQTELEFGSFESGLMESAAAFLSSQARNSNLVQELEQLLISVVKVLVSTIEAKDPYTRGHSERVAEYARMIARELGFSEDQAHRIHFNGLLHDIGKIGIPDAILQKPGKLTDEEFDHIKAHPAVGWSILRQVDSLSYVKPGVLYHHERFDGQGYPTGLSGTQIPLVARVMAVADAFDAMTTNRSYRRRLSFEKVQAILTAGAGTQWDPDVVEAAHQVMPQLIAFASASAASAAAEAI